MVLRIVPPGLRGGNFVRRELEGLERAIARERGIDPHARGWRTVIGRWRVRHAARRIFQGRLYVAAGCRPGT